MQENSRTIAGARPEEDSILLRNGKSPSLVTDFNKNGIADYFDSDIDGDGVPNLIDSDPFDSTVGSEDKNQNGIPDFIDFAILYPENLRKSEIQITVYKKYGIYLAEDRTIFSIKELEQIQYWLAQPVFFKINKTLKVILKRKSEGLFNTERGLYFGPWQTIIVFPTDSFLEAFLHEMIHALFYQNQEVEILWETAMGWALLNKDDAIHSVNQLLVSSTKRYIWSEFEFLQNGKSIVDRIRSENPASDFLKNFPSDYAFKSPSEHLAEAGAATLMILNKKTSHYFSLNEFEASAAFLEFKKLF